MYSYLLDFSDQHSVIHSIIHSVRLSVRHTVRLSISNFVKNNKLGLNCAKLRLNIASQLARIFHATLLFFSL